MPRLVALAQKADAQYIVSGGTHLTQLTDPSPPVLTPRGFPGGYADLAPPQPSDLRRERPLSFRSQHLTMYTNQSARLIDPRTATISGRPNLGKERQSHS